MADQRKIIEEVTKKPASKTPQIWALYSEVLEYYDQGMKVSAKFKPDANLKKGELIITRIIKPQVNYSNVIIQEAQVEVSVGEREGESG